MSKIKNYVMGIEEDLYNIDGFETIVTESDSYSEFTKKLLDKPEFHKVYDQYGAAWVRDILLQVWNEYWEPQYV